MGATDNERIENLIEQLEEMAANMGGLIKENEALTKLLSADSTMLAAATIVKKLTREVEVLRERNAGLMIEKNDAIAHHRGSFSSPP